MEINVMDMGDMGAPHLPCRHVGWDGYNYTYMMAKDIIDGWH